MQVEAKKILVIKLRAIGDVVLSTIVLKNLRRAYPNAQIDFLTETASSEVVQGNDLIDKTIILDRQFLQTLSVFKRGWWNYQFLRRIHSSSYDLVFDFFGNPRSAFLTLMTRAPCRVGYDFRIRRWAYTSVTASRADQVHEAEFHLDALRSVGIPCDNKELSFFIPESATEFAEQLWSDLDLHNRFVVAVNVWGGWPAKRWPLEKFVQLCDRFIEHLSAKVLLIWGPGEKPHATKVAHQIKGKAIVLPPTDLKQLAAVLKKCDMMVSNDSGPMHISAAVNTPTVGIFGPTNADLQGPYGEKHEVAKLKSLECLGCNQLTCDHNRCMTLLTVQEVWEVVMRCLDKNKISFLLDKNI